MFTFYINRFNSETFHALPTECIYLFCLVLNTNTDYFLINY